MTIGVVLMTFGSATTAADVPTYLRSVRRGSDASDDVVAEFRRRYDAIGRSPLIDTTLAQAAAVEVELNGRVGTAQFLVRAGMQHSAPSIAAAVSELAEAGATRIAGVVMSPQYSPVIMAGYNRLLAEACAAAGLPFAVADAWHEAPEFVSTLAEAIDEALRGFDADVRDRVPVIFTAHSLPRSVVDRDPGYLAQIDATVRAVAARAGLDESRWTFAYQSSGHTPEEWLRPDFRELLPGFRERGVGEVLVVPTQFLADHLEVLYDIDVAGAEEAAELGMAFRRIAMPNLTPRFIRALADVAEGAAAPAATA